MEKKLSRRSAMQRVSYLVGGVVATPTLLNVIQGCQQSAAPLNWTSQFFDEEQSRMVSLLTEIIIPRTETPGAIDAGVPALIDQIYGACLTTDAQLLFTDGLSTLESMAQEQHGSAFLKLDSETQSDLLKQIGKSQSESAAQDTPADPTFFQQLKQLTLLGYFSSEMGATEALQYLQIPGSYQGCTTMEPGQKAWAV